MGGHHGTGHQYSPFQTGKGDRFAVDRVDYHERSEVLRFSSVEDWFKGVDLAPKEKTCYTRTSPNFNFLVFFEFLIEFLVGFPD